MYFSDVELILEWVLSLGTVLKSPWPYSAGPNRICIHIHLASQTVTFFRNGVFAGVMTWYGRTGLGPMSNGCCPYEKAMWRHAESRTPCDDRVIRLQVRDSPGWPANSQKLLERSRKILPHSPQKEPYYTLISDLWPLELWENRFLYSSTTSFVGVCYGSPRKWICRFLSYLQPQPWRLRSRTLKTEPGTCSFVERLRYSMVLPPRHPLC